MTLFEFATEVLGPSVDTASFASHSFIELGGDSLRAMRFVALVQDRTGARIPVASLLGDATLAAVLEAVPPLGTPADGGGTTGERPGSAAGLSHAQRGMWLIESVTGGSPYNLVFIAFVEDGRLDEDLFRRAVAATVARHPGLRTVYRERDGAVAAEVLAEAVPDIETVTHDGDPAGFDDFVREVAAERGRRPFDLAAAPPLRLLLAGHPSGPRAAVLMAHHIVLDGWAVGLLLRELFARYDALSRGAPDPLPAPGVPPAALFEHQAASRARGEWERQARFWVDHLAGVPAVLDLPADRGRPAIQDAAGARAPLDLGEPVSAAVLERARQLGITPFAFLLGAFALTLRRVTGARTLLVGVPLTGRATPKLEELVAVAGNLVPVRVDVDDDATVAGYLRSVHRSLTASIDAGDLPFEELVARLGVERGLGCHPLVQVCFGMHDQLVPQRIDAGGLRVRVEEAHGGGSQFDLTLLVRQSRPSLAGHLEYATGVWGPAEVEGFLADFRAAVGELARVGRLPAADDTPLEEVRCLSPARRAVLDRLNDTRRDFPATSIDALFREAVRRHPDAVAVREGDLQLSYVELAAAAVEQARLLRESGVCPGDRVLVALPRSVAETVAVVGTVWAGAAYVGVDLSQPAAHTDQILARARPAAALVPPESADRLAAHGIPQVAAWQPTWPVPAAVGDARGAVLSKRSMVGDARGAVLSKRSMVGDARGAVPSKRSTDSPAAPAEPDRVAYVAFTSGSTGVPKGVVVPHRGVIRLVHEVDYARLGPGERMLRLSPLAFDASTLEIWGALLTGATLEVHPAGLPSPSELGAFLVERGVTVAWLTAGLFRLVEEFSPDSLGALRQLLTGGDVVPHEHAARTLARHPGLVITNGYGPTENTTFTLTHSVASPSDVDGPLPIGTPLPGTRVYVLDERYRLVPPGAAGELFAAGEGLADGYLGDPAETNRCFGDFSPDVPERLYRTGDIVRVDTQGRVRFLGRRDDQVKLRGYRVELSAIGDALTAHPSVRDAVVAVTEGDSAEKRLVAAVVPEPGAAPAAVELRDFLSRRLPSYMVPTLWAVLDRIPVTGNGKVDRRAIVAAASPASAVTAGVAASAGALPPHEAAPSTVDGPLAELARLFGEAINRGDRVDIAADTDFFTVGGDSMGAVRLVRLVKQRLDVTVRLRDFLLSPTPAGLHHLVEKAGAR
jgi:amino acid adenylation domain-containing protein